MKSFLVFSILFTAVLLFTGCERKITGDVDAIVDISSESCFGCHGDNNNPIVDKIAQFATSIHNSGDHTYLNRFDDHESCERCHTSEGFIAYVTGVPAEGDHFTSFNCFTCHEPHSNGDFRLRTAEAYTLENGAIFDYGNGNICANCHHSRRDVNEYVFAGVKLSSHWGPHYSNQADMLAGENAYEFDGYDYNGSWHETGVVNGCPSCHMSAPGHESIGGHSWNMRNDDLELENISGCNIAGCHLASPVESVDRETVFDFDDDGELEGVQKEMEDMLAELGAALEAAGLVDEDHVPVSNLIVNNIDSAGAVYNFLFVEEDRSVGVHNTAYAVALMKSAINYLTTGDPNGAPYGPKNSNHMLLSAH